MTNARVIVSLAAALILTVAAVVLLRSPAVPGGGTGMTPTGTGILAVDPARVVEIRVQRPSGAEGGAGAGVSERLVKTGTGEWDVLIPTADGGERAWPVPATRVRAGLRLLSEAAFSPSAGTEWPADGKEAGLIFIADDGSHEVVRLSDQRLAGKVRVRSASGQVGLIDQGLYDALVTTGPRGWRETAAMPGLGVDASRIRLETPAGTVLLGRVAGRWGLQAPVVAPADQRAVERLIGQLAASEIVRFLDDSTVEELDVHLRPPVAVVSAETDRRVPVGEEFVRRTERRELRIGRPADIAEKTLFATIGGRSADGAARALPVTVERGALESISMDAATYLARTSARAVPADVGGVRLLVGEREVREVVRTVDGWMDASDDGARTPLTSEGSSGVGALLTLLCETPADVATIEPEGRAGAGAESVLTIQLLALDGEIAEEIAFEAGESGVATRVGGVRREYQHGAAEAAVRWVRETN